MAAAAEALKRGRERPTLVFPSVLGTPLDDSNGPKESPTLSTHRRTQVWHRPMSHPTCNRQAANWVLIVVVGSPVMRTDELDRPIFSSQTNDALVRERSGHAQRAGFGPCVPAGQRRSILSENQRRALDFNLHSEFDNALWRPSKKVVARPAF